MKCAIRCSVMSLGAFSLTTIASLPAAAQFVAIPISNGSFALRGTGGGTEYVNSATPMTLLSPAGTINITSVPLPDAAVTPTITTNTPVGMYFGDVAGSASLNDGRTANFTNGYLKLQSLGTVSGAAASPMLPTAAGVVVNYAVQAGSLAIPQDNVSAYPASTVSIPISGGSFTISVPPNGQAGTVTINSLLTPQGTTNLTLTLPDLAATPGIGDLQLDGTNQAVLMHAIANGSIALTNGNVATVNNRLVTLTGTALRTNGADFWYGEQIPETTTNIEVTVTGGSINVPQAAIGLPTSPTQPSQLTQPPQSSQPIQPPTSNSVNLEASTSRPTPVVVSSSQTTVSFNFADDVRVVDQSTNPLRQLALPSQPQAISEADGSPLAISRIHPGLQAKF
jgi:hypothetical protein